MMKSEVPTMQIEAVYEHGVLRPVKPLSLAEGERVELTLTGPAPALEKKLSKAEREARDIEIINQNIDALSEEAWDVLSYQVEL